MCGIYALERGGAFLCGVYVADYRGGWRIFEDSQKKGLDNFFIMPYNRGKLEETSKHLYNRQ